VTGVDPRGRRVINGNKFALSGHPVAEVPLPLLHGRNADGGSIDRTVQTEAFVVGKGVSLLPPAPRQPGNLDGAAQGPAKIVFDVLRPSGATPLAGVEGGVAEQFVTGPVPFIRARLGDAC